MQSSGKQGEEHEKDLNGGPFEKFEPRANGKVSIRSSKSNYDRDVVWDSAHWVLVGKGFADSPSYCEPCWNG